MNKNIIILIVLITALILTIGCTPGSKIDIGMTDQEFINKVVASSTSIKSYDFSMDMKMNLVMTAQGTTETVTMDSNGTGTIDLTISAEYNTI